MSRRAVVPVAGLALLALFLVLKRSLAGPPEAQQAPKANALRIAFPTLLPESQEGTKDYSTQTSVTSDGKPVLDRQSPAAAFASLIEYHRAARKKLARIPEANTDGFSWSHAYGYVVARLLALCHPEEIETCALKVLSEPGADENDALLAIKTLGVLASRGRESAEYALVEASRRKNWVTVKAALEGLFDYDKDGMYRGMYLAQMTSGMMEIAQHGPYWPDEQTKQLLTQLLGDGNQPGKPKIGGFITEALARVSLLESPDRAALLEELVAYRRDSPDWSVKLQQRQVWALRVVAMNPTPHAVKMLRERLTIAEVEAMEIIQKDTERFPRSIHPGYAHATGDDYYDQALLTYWRIGGELNLIEKQRLSYYGYLGDPIQRLAELTCQEK